MIGIFASLLVGMEYAIRTRTRWCGRRGSLRHFFFFESERVCKPVQARMQGSRELRGPKSLVRSNLQGGEIVSAREGL